MSDTINIKHNHVSIETASSLIRSVMAKQMNDIKNNVKFKHINISITGSPGVGKTSSIHHVLTEIGFRVIDIRLSAMEAYDVLGQSYNDEGVLRFNTPFWLLNKDDGVPTVIVLDELPSASPSVQTAANRLLLERSTQSGEKLPDHFFFIAAGNLKSDKTGARDYIPSLANRFGMHLVIDINTVPDTFLNYAVRSNFNKSIIGYCEWRRNSIYQPYNGEPNYATPRVWEDVNNMSETDAWESTHTRTVMISAAVGSSIAIDFEAYLANYARLPNWKLIRSGEEVFKVERGEEAIAATVATNIGGELMDAFKSEKYDELDNLLEIVKGLSKEYLVLMFRNIRRYEGAASILQYVNMRPFWEAAKSGMRSVA